MCYLHSALQPELDGGQASVCGVLCLVDVDGLPLLSPVTVNGVAVIGGRAAAKLACRPGALTDEAISTLHAKLALALPSA